MAERYNSCERIEKPVLPIGARGIHALSSQSTIHQLQVNKHQNKLDKASQVLPKKFMDDLEKAIKLFSLKTTLWRLRHMQQNAKPSCSFILMSADIDDDTYDPEIAEIAIKEEYRTRPPRRFQKVYLFDPKRKDLTPLENENVNPQVPQVPTFARNEE